MKVELIANLGDDLTVVNAARVSFDKQSSWKRNIQAFGEKELHEKDIKLITYLAKHNHFTPFTHCSITLRETVPIFVARQRFKHTIGFTYNELSRRYLDDDPDFYSSWGHHVDVALNADGSRLALTYDDFTMPINGPTSLFDQLSSPPGAVEVDAPPFKYVLIFAIMF